MTLSEFFKANPDVKRSEFADAIGVSQSALSMYVSNKRFPSAFTLMQIERVTDKQVTASDMAMEHYK